MADRRSTTLFRPEALAEHEAGARFEGLVRVTGPRYWMALLAVLVVIVAAVVGATVARAPVTASGPGLMVGPAGLGAVTAPTPGILVGRSVEVGDPVAPGQTVGAVAGSDGVARPLVSRVAGTVLDVVGDVGATIPPGAVLLSVLPPDAIASAQVFVPLSEAAGLRPGLAVRVSPTGFPSSQFGAVTGTVRGVGASVASPADVAALVPGNAALADPLLETGPAVQVDVALDRGPTPSGYAWTAGGGPEATVVPGSPVTATIVIAPRRAVDLLGGS